MKGYMTIAMVVALGFALIFGTSIPQVHASSLAIDGTAKYQGACATTCTVALTTGTTNDVIYLIFTSVVTPTTNPPTVTDAASLSWSLRTSVANTGGIMYSYWAISAAALTADTITVTATEAGTTATIYAFGISGANTASPFDPHSGIPATVGAASTPFNLAITTSNANDMIIGAIQGSSTAFAVAAPNTAVDAFNFATAAISAVEDDIVSSTGTYTVSFTSGGPAASELIADAVQASGASVPEFPFQLAMPVILIGAMALYFIARFAQPSIGKSTGPPASV
jgi:hypothetical protein